MRLLTLSATRHEGLSREHINGLAIQGQALINMGVTNSDGAVWGGAIVSLPAGGSTLIAPSVPSPLAVNQFSFTNLAFPIHLAICDANNSNVDLTLQTNTVIVGQQMNWIAQLELTNGTAITNFPLSKFQWTVPGYAISNFVVAEDVNSAVVVTNFPVNNTNIVFYWVDGGSNLIVQCSATVRGHTITGQAVFNVLRPTARIITQTGSVSVNST